MTKLYVLYDPKCELCCRLKNWLLVQRSWIGMAVVEVGSEKAKKLFPELEQISTDNDLAVISDEGAVYLNDRAWIMVMYAMVEYRDWAARLTHPLLMPLARQAFAAISKNRHAISRWLSTTPPEAIAAELRNVPLEPCAAPAGQAVRPTNAAAKTESLDHELRVSDARREPPPTTDYRLPTTDIRDYLQ